MNNLVAKFGGNIGGKKGLFLINFKVIEFNSNPLKYFVDKGFRIKLSKFRDIRVKP